MSNLLIYIKKYNDLKLKRSKLDAQIDFMEDLLKTKSIEKSAFFKLTYYDKDGNELNEVFSEYES